MHLVEYLYGELDEMRRKELESDLERDPILQRELIGMRKVRSIAAQLAQHEVPPTVSERVLRESRRLAPGADPSSWLQRLRQRMRLAVLHPAMAAAVGLVLVAGVMLYLDRRGAVPKREMAPSEPELVAAGKVATSEGAHPRGGNVAASDELESESADQGETLGMSAGSSAERERESSAEPKDVREARGRERSPTLRRKRAAVRARRRGLAVAKRSAAQRVSSGSDVELDDTVQPRDDVTGAYEDVSQPALARARSAPAYGGALAPAPPAKPSASSRKAVASPMRAAPSARSESAEKRQSSAASTLVRQSRQAMVAGACDDGLELLDRALAIDPAANLAPAAAVIDRCRTLLDAQRERFPLVARRFASDRRSRRGAATVAPRRGKAAAGATQADDAEGETGR